jgi:DNA-binding CsgD family transcriptional regulator
MILLSGTGELFWSELFIMNIFSFISALALAITLIEGLYILLRDYKSEINRLFFLICLSISVWLFGGCFGYSSQNREDTFFWLKVTSPGFIFMHAFVLHFILRYTELIKSRLIYLIYIPSFYFLYISLNDHLVFSDIYKSGNYWVMVPDYNSLNFYLLMVNYLSYYIISLVILYFFMRKTESFRIRRQSRLIFVAILITISSYNAEPFLAPLFFNYLTYGQAPVYSIVWISLMWYAMMKYRFLSLDKNYLYSDILDSLSEMVVIMDIDKKVIMVNRAMSGRLGISNKIKSLNEMFVEFEMVERQLNSVNEKSVSAVILNLMLPGKETMLVKGDISLFKDSFDDIAGFVIIVQSLDGEYSRLKKRGITEREYELIKQILSGNSNRQISAHFGISRRTVETHITNIFNKLGLKSRIELINYCSDIFSSSSK